MPEPEAGGHERNTDGRSGGDHTDAIGKWLGLLLAGLASAFAFFGVEGEEVSTVLRNQRWEATVITLLVAAALGASVVSFFARGRMPVLLALAVVSATLAINPAMVFGITTGSRASNWAHGASALVALSLLGLAIVLAAASAVEVWRRRRPRWHAQPARGDAGIRRWPVRPVVLSVGVLLLTTAVYSALRLETRSQLRSTSPQVSASFEREGDVVKVALDIEAERLRSSDDISVTVWGRPRSGESIEAQCGAGGPGSSDAYESCVQRPCDVLDCVFIAGAQLTPDAFGRIDDTFELPIDPATADHVAIRAELCLRDDDQGGAPVSADLDRRQSQCAGRRRLTALDSRVPHPDGV